jgi:hypothetical protein
MKRTRLIGMASMLGVVMLAPRLFAQGSMMIAPTPIAQRVATADCVVVGKVAGFGDKLVSATPVPGAKNKVDYQIAIIKTEEDILGAKDLKEIRVGFIPPMPPAGGGGGIRPAIRRLPQVSFTLDQEACLFLTKHPEGDFYTATTIYGVINKKGNADFAKDLDEAKRCAQFLAAPKAGLEAKNPADRLLTAGMLVARYRQRRPSAAPPKTEAIDEEVSKKILHTLADANWNARPAPFQMTPLTIFSQLNLTPKDGWTPPKHFKQFPETARKWLQDNADSYRIERFVYDNDKADR